MSCLGNLTHGGVTYGGFASNLGGVNALSSLMHSHLPSETSRYLLDIESLNNMLRSTDDFFAI